jgi:heme/copper-type cytochrome/quinol oxidase subunit 1
MDGREQMSFFNAILILLAIPALNGSILMLLCDRLLGGALIHGAARECGDVSSRWIVPATF